MPIVKLCISPGCKAYAINGKCYCEKHYVEKKPFQSAVRSNNYNSAEWRQLKAEIRKEQTTCANCGRTAIESGYPLEAHHIIPPRGNLALFYDKNNIVMLCKECHSQITNEEIKGRKKDGK